MLLTITPSVTWIIIWGVVFVAALVIEVLTVQMVSVWACGGAFVSLFLAAFGVPYYYQLAVFAIVTAVCLIVCKAVYRPKKDDKKTNADALIGNDVEVLETVAQGKPGSAKVRDVTWTIEVDEDIEITKGEYATVKNIEGSHLVVEKKKEIID